MAEEEPLNAALAPCGHDHKAIGAHERRQWLRLCAQLLWAVRTWREELHPLPLTLPVPLRVHGRHREGVLWHQPSATDLLFITLRNSEALFSPSTRTRDQALGPSLFHWESQSTAGRARSPSRSCASALPPTKATRASGRWRSAGGWSGRSRRRGCQAVAWHSSGVGGLRGAPDWVKRLRHTMSYRIRLLETEEGWAVSCLDLPGCHSQGDSRDEALANIREAITLWLEVEAEEAGVKSVETLELAL